MVTVIVNYLNLISSVNRLKSISRNVNSRNLKISMNRSKGDFADQLELLADRILTCGLSFADLAGKTAGVLEEAKAAFIETDESAAGQYKG